MEADKDKKIKFRCLQSEVAKPYMMVCGLEREEVLRQFLFVEGPRSDVALRVLSCLTMPHSVCTKCSHAYSNT